MESLTGSTLEIKQRAKVKKLQKLSHEIKLEEARAARKALSAELKTLGCKVPATVSAGYNVKTGEVATSAYGGGKCVEDHVVDSLGGVKADVIFTEATRPRLFGQPRHLSEVDVCKRCEASYGRNPFPSNTIFKSDNIKEK